jgi:pyrimidine operon attenuation protein/uracil phosphoribosyltransferase
MADEMNLIEKSRIMDGARMKRAISRLASEIVEDNQGAKDLYLVGIRRRGVRLPNACATKSRNSKARRQFSASSTLRSTATIYQPSAQTRLSTALNSTRHRRQKHHFNRRRALHGRTIRAALDQLMDFGRPRKVQLAVLIDRGKEHRELPIQADFTGKVVPTKKSEIVKVMLKEFDDIEAVGIFERP